MSRHVPVNAADHRDLRVNPAPRADLGDQVMSCLTVPIEFRRVQNEFPILFQRNPETGRLHALAMMGFEEGENLFLDGDRWTARYRPLALAIAPFRIGRSSNPDEPAQVHIDLDHPRVGDPEGVRLFDDSGLASPLLERASDMLHQLDVGLAAAGDFYDALDRYELLEPFALDVTLDDGSESRLVGYQLINEEKLQELEAGAVAELHRDGHLMPMFMALASLSNMTDLLARKNRRERDG
ncbi:SapC family protein [Sphingomonas astaxanthinifaciens]|uniref:Peptidase n=1 Tax=Sphingomonas astaxanthinifaciens DSM 22298 TaxID=1123267 RepID=A0ABQ5ZA56_9SPHN|nr:SapC family protein [Sphingomonas astaxanthinifaciens]GLR48346.1 peptidase [Sphingomonas astaxanthinifaciens DSM 22298]